MAALALTDNVFLIIHCLANASRWSPAVDLINHPVACQVMPETSLLATLWISVSSWANFVDLFEWKLPFMYNIATEIENLDKQILLK